MSSREQSNPEEVISPPPPTPSTAAVLAPHKEVETSPTEEPPRHVTGRITNVWSLLEVLLDSEAATKRFLGLLAFVLITSAAAAGLALGILLLVIPQATLASKWIWPTMGAGGAANLLLLVRAWGLAKGVRAAGSADSTSQDTNRRAKTHRTRKP